VVPIGLCTNKTRIKAKFEAQDKLFKGFVEFTEHRVDFGFVVPFHKVQGKTLNKVILELNQRPFRPPLTFNMLLVALSRVKSREGIRIVKLAPGKDLKYLIELKRDPDLRTWMAGFDQKGKWNPKISQIEGKVDPNVQSSNQLVKSAPKRPQKEDLTPTSSKRAKLQHPSPKVPKVPKVAKDSKFAKNIKDSKDSKIPNISGAPKAPPPAQLPKEKGKRKQNEPEVLINEKEE